MKPETCSGYLCDRDDNRIPVTIAYELEYNRIPDDSPVYGIVYARILSDIPSWFIPDDIDTDVECNIAFFEKGKTVRLMCEVEYAQKQRWQRIAIMNKTCKFLKVA